MYIYVIGTVISMLCAKYAMNAKQYPALKESYRIWAIWSFLPLFLISAFRYKVGTDYEPIYEEYFYAINSGEAEFSEIGFNLINKITYWIAKDPALMFAVVSFFTIMFMYLAFYQQSVNVSYSIAFFVLSTAYFNSMNQIRQTLAMSIFLYAMKYIYSRKPVKYFLWILLAFSMHTSAILYVPIYFIYNLRVNIKVHVMILAAVIVSTPIMQKLVLIVIRMTPYAWYLESVYSENGFSLIQFLFCGVILVLLYFCYLNSTELEDKEMNLMLYMYLFAMVFVTYSAAIPQSNRLVISMTVITPLIVPRALLRIKERGRRIGMLCIFLGVFALRILHDVYLQGWYDVLPYQTILSK